MQSSRARWQRGRRGSCPKGETGSPGPHKGVGALQAGSGGEEPAVAGLWVGAVTGEEWNGEICGAQDLCLGCYSMSALSKHPGRGRPSPGNLQEE